jgi:hypothetical protein
MLMGEIKSTGGGAPTVPLSTGTDVAVAKKPEAAKPAAPVQAANVPANVPTPNALLGQRAADAPPAAAANEAAFRADAAMRKVFDRLEAFCAPRLAAWKSGFPLPDGTRAELVTELERALKDGSRACVAAAA